MMHAVWIECSLGEHHEQAPLWTARCAASASLDESESSHHSSATVPAPRLAIAIFAEQPSNHMLNVPDATAHNAATVHCVGTHRPAATCPGQVSEACVTDNPLGAHTIFSNPQHPKEASHPCLAARHETQQASHHPDGARPQGKRPSRALALPANH